MRIPVSTDEITPEWLSSVLDCQVSHLSKKLDADSAGLVSSMCFLEVGYQDESRGPDRLLAKMVPDFEDSFELAAMNKLFVRECNFYKNIAARIPLRTPRAYYAEADEETGVGCLLLEDCSHYQLIDQNDPQPTSLEQLQDIMVATAKLSAATWDLDWPTQDPWVFKVPDPASKAFTDSVQLGWQAFLTSNILSLVPKEFIPIAERLAREYSEIFQNAWPKDRLSLGHGDYRINNFFIDSKSKDSILVFDWQSPTMQRNAMDLGYLISTGYTPEFRRANDSNLIRIYHQELTAQGISNYTEAEAWHDYLFGTLFGSRLIPMFVNDFDVSSPAGNILVRKVIDGVCSSILENGGLELLDRVQR